MSNKNLDQNKDHVIIGREIYTNLFSIDIFASISQEQNINFKTDNYGNLILADVNKDVYSKETQKTANELYKLLNKKNENVSAETIQELYEAFAKFRYSLACYLTGQKNDGDIYNYFKYAPWTSNKKIRNLKAQIHKIEEELDPVLKLFLSDMTGDIREMYKTLGTKIFYLDQMIKDNKKNIEGTDQKINNCNSLIEEQEAELEKYEHNWHSILAWALYDESSVTNEFDKRDVISKVQDKIKHLKAEQDNLNDKLNKLTEQQQQLERLKSINELNIINLEFKNLGQAYSDIENEKCRIFKKAHPELADKLNDEQIIDIIFKIERQQALLEDNEVFFKNMILKSRNKNFLAYLGGKSFNEFLRDERNHLVNFISDTNGCKENDVEKHKKDVQNSSTGDIYKIHVKDKNYYIKIGDLFLDTLDKKKNAVTGEEEPASEVAVAQEMYRGTTTKEIYDEVGNKYLNKSAAKQNLVDTGSHGLLMNAFANIFDFGVDVLVDSTQIVSSAGNHILMKEAQGKLFNDLIEKYFNIGYIQLSDFIKAEVNQKVKIDQNKDQSPFSLIRLAEFKKEKLETISKKLPSCNLQNSVIEINILDYIFSNADRNIGNVFVTKDGVIGIDQDISSPMEDKEYHKDFIINYTKNDLPNLIPYATKIQYDKIKMMVTPAGKKLTENTIKMWIKTVDEDTLNSIVKIIIKRIDEIYAHFKNLDSQKRILKTKEEFNKQTVLEIAEGSIKFQGKRLETLKKIGATNVFNGAGAIFWANYNDAPKPKKDSLI